MTQQTCPQCHQLDFLWHIDDDVTHWCCYKCGYAATEDESRLSTCPACNSEKSLLRLTDGDREYWYCLTCFTDT